MCSILCWILSIWEALGCIFCIFWLDSCIVNKGEKFEHVLGYWMHLEGFQVVLSHFWDLLCTGLTGCGHRSGRSRVLALFTCCSAVWPVALTGLTGQSRDDVAALFSSSGVHAFVQGEFHCFRGSLHVCRGSSLWFSSFGLVVCALCLSIVLSRMCRAVALS
jgi:hypothetical protein